MSGNNDAARTPEQYDLAEGMTWGKDQINSNDVKYVRSDIAEAELKAARADAKEAWEKLSEQWISHAATIQKLAAEQAKNVELLSIVWEVNKYLDQTYADLIGNIGSEWLISRIVDHLSPSLSKALSTPSDTSALEAIVKKAGEVMRERCAAACAGPNEDWNIFADDVGLAIRAIPGVTIDDLKGE